MIIDILPACRTTTLSPPKCEYSTGHNIIAGRKDGAPTGDEYKLWVGLTYVT